MTFDIDTEMIIDSLVSALEDAGSRASEEQMTKILDAIDEGMPGVIGLLAQGMAEHWKTEAINAGGWGSKYARAIQYDINGNQSTVFLDEDIIDQESGKPNFMFSQMMEYGVKSWSIKDALMQSDRVKMGPNGVKYITVPFPIAVPRKSGQGKMQNKFGKREMSQEIHNIVKSGGKIPAGTMLKTGYGNEVNITGLTQYNTRQRHSQYGIFRRVSEKSKGWIYPNIPKEPVYPSVLQEVNKKIGEIVSEFLREIVKEYTM